MKKIYVFFISLVFCGVFIFYNFAFGDESESIFFSQNLKFGSRGEEVKNLQALLSRLPGIYEKGKATGYFGKLTRVAVRKFQRSYKIKISGAVDSVTRIKLNQIAERLAFKEPAIIDSAVGTPPAPTSVKTPKSSSLPFSESKPYFTYNWKADSTITGEVKLPIAFPKPVITLDGQPTVTIQSSAATKIFQAYKIVLADDELPWDEFSAAMLLEMIQRLPNSPFYQSNFKPWRITLTDLAINNDVEITSDSSASFNKARFSKPAFERSNPTLQPGEFGSPDRVFYSNRLFQAVLRAFYTERSYMEEVIKQRYGVKAGIAEPADEFQEFNVGELQYIASVFEDLPSGFRNMPGLEKIVRRKQGLTRPGYPPETPAIAWVTLGYIEFLDPAFVSANRTYIQRLVAHEITHFLWHGILSDETKKKFMSLSGWSQTGLNNWARVTTTNFVSDYAAAINPDEDFAETVSYYVYQPDLVRTIAPDKYNFVKDIIDGYEYVILVDKQFTFQVFNLEPDVTFPGKIIAININAYKTNNGDNRVVADLHLSSKFGDGAEMAYTRIFSPVDTYTDQYFYPVDGNKFLLRADFEITKYAAKGYWVADNITVMDRVDNRRYEGQKNFGWLLFIDNPEEDLDAPIADLNNIRLELTKGDDGDDMVVVYVPVTDKNQVGLGGRANLNHYESGQSEFNYAEYNSATKELLFKFSVRKYKASGLRTFREFWIFDIAGNQNRYDLKEKALTVEVKTERPDYVKPSLDVSSIKITATPKKPQAPDGETDVAIWYAAWDDNSGLGNVNYTLLKPNGQVLFDYHYHENFHTSYFINGLPTDRKIYKIELTLPPGSIPGTWILREISLNDKAGNQLTSNFVEIGIVRPFKVF